MRRKILEGLGIAFAALLIAVLLEQAGAFVRLERINNDLLARKWAEPSEATHEIRLVLLDQASLDWSQEINGLSWPWPRELYAPIVQFFERAGVRAIGFDVLYTEPSFFGVEDDETLGKAFEGQLPVSLALFLSNEDGNFEWPDGYPPPQKAGTWFDAAGRAGLTARSATFPIPELCRSATALAGVRGFPDPDGVLRSQPLFQRYGSYAVPSLGCSLYQLVSGQLAINDQGVTQNGKPIPLKKNGSLLLNYAGDESVYRPLRAAAVIQSELKLQAGEKAALDPAEFKDAIILFGFSAPGLLDLRSTPLSDVSPGVLGHAVLLDNLLSGQFLQEISPAMIIVIALLLACLSALSMRFCSRAGLSLWLFMLLIIPPLISFLTYPNGLLWPVMPSFVAMILALVGTMALNYATEGRQKAFIKKAFKQYLSPAVIEQLLDNPGQLQLGGERRELSIYFSDLQGFSSFSEKMEPQQLTALLNEYLTEMTNIILEEGGTLDKYEGDAVMAFWNAPLQQDDHALRACRTALRCQERLGKIREDIRARYGVELFQRIGLHSGEVVVGNMGSHDRFDYTVLGDAANLASRLEGANKALGTFIMISGESWNKLNGQLPGRELGQLRVVGREAPVSVFEAGTESEIFAKGLAAIRSQNWALALEKFESLEGADPAAAHYARRCRELMVSGESWDGVWNLTSK